jgi:hypothetical protein
MATFRKFAFPDGATAEKLLVESLQPLDFAVQVGEIDKAVCVDILFHDTCPEPLAAFVVWPEPCGVHSFSGWEEQYEADYKEFATQSQK